MCGNNPNVAPQVNNAKCIGGTALGFAIVTIVGFLLDWPGAISAVAGILSVIANSIVCCCGPRAKGEGAGKFTAAMVLNIIACILHFAAIIGVVVFYLGMVAHVNAETAKCVECAWGSSRPSPPPSARPPRRRSSPTARRPRRSEAGSRERASAQRRRTAFSARGKG